VGLSQGKIVKIFVYEAFVLVVSSALQGVGIGVFIGWLITF
jgi:ABC-type lipoprotein release transport system permease subunit